MPWPMKLIDPFGPPVRRGACVSCQDPATVDQVLKSVTVGGSSVCVCERCETLPQYAKNLK
jgi:hypothetical protein